MKKEKLKEIIKAGVDATGRLPKVADIAAELHMKIYPTQKLLKQLADEGFLRKAKNNWYEIDDGTKPALVEEVKQVIIENAHVAPEYLFGNTPTPALALVESQSKMALPVIKYSMLAVGVGSVVISAYYNVLLALDFLPAFLAIIAGCIFVLFSVVSFETILLFSTFKSMNKWKRRVTMAGLVIVWLVAVIFSITSVVNGRYEKYMSTQHDKAGSNMSVNAERLKWNNLQERKKALIMRINERRAQLTKAELVNDKKLERYNASIEAIRGLEINMIKKNPEATDANRTAGDYTDFYAWLAAVLSVSKEKIHFFISMLPAFFFDVISPIAIALFLFLKKN